MRPLPIRLRLTLWYFLVLAAGLLAFAVFTFLSLGHAIHRTVDTQLEAHIAAVRKIINEDENKNLSTLRSDLDEDVELAPDLTLLQIWDANQNVVYRSAALDHIHAPSTIPETDGKPANHVYHHHPLRILVRPVSTPAVRYTVMAAIPVHDFTDAMERVAGTFWIAIPLLLLTSFAGGYWIAGRALSPIGSMIAAAEAIRPEDMSARLVIPPANDEVQQLAITLNRMLGRLQAAFERITRFTADASHELRTPIALLRTRTELLLRHPRESAEYRAGLQENLKELEQTSALIEELMLLARGDAGAETLHFTSIDLVHLLRSTAASAQPLAEAKHLAWTIKLPSESVHIRADESSIRRLVLVLLDNAVKYTPKDGHICLSMQQQGDSAWIAVSDTGPGIPERDVPYIFERFYRADPARTTGGAGLGLSIAQWIAEKHGTRITVAPNPAGGSIFSIAFRIGSLPA